MRYRDGYKYQLVGDESFKTSFRPENEIKTNFITLFESGMMVIHNGYAWDGASGIVDRDTNLRASCGHDALYQLMRMGKLPHSDWAKADNDYCRWLKDAGAWDITITFDRWGLSKFKGKYAKPSQRKKVHLV